MDGGRRYPDRTQIRMAEDIAAMKQLLNDQKEQIEKIEGYMVKISQQLNEQGDSITALKTQNKVLKGLLATFVAVAGALITLLQLIRGW